MLNKHQVTTQEQPYQIIDIDLTEGLYARLSNPEISLEVWQGSEDSGQYVDAFGCLT